MSKARAKKYIRDQFAESEIEITDTNLAIAIEMSRFTFGHQFKKHRKNLMKAGVKLSHFTEYLQCSESKIRSVEAGKSKPFGRELLKSCFLNMSNEAHVAVYGNRRKMMNALGLLAYTAQFSEMAFNLIETVALNDDI